MAVDANVYITGSVYSWMLLPTRDGGLPYDVTAQAVTLRLRAFSGTYITLTPTLIGNNWVAVCTDIGALSLSVPGSWDRSWLVVDGTGPHAGAPIFFTVIEAP